jgi:1-acyl-sn-glycerol-3-phosphate acyltransferase
VAEVSVVLRVGYGLWCWAAFVALALLALLLAICAPSVGLRRGGARSIARLYFRATGVRLAVIGAERLPAGACVVVANHASYVDALIMQAALPAHFAFVIKKEMVRVPLAGLLLRRLGSQFVERHNRHQGGVDARRVLRTAASGQSLAFFPEGTFGERVGLARFHAGAFVAAARARLPLVPVAIRGARALLPSGAALPRHGAIEVEILAPLLPSGEDEPDDAVRLRRAARAAILAHIPDPDLDS